MGLGGNLIWTRVLEAIYEADQRTPVVCHKPGLSDLMVGRLYDSTVSLADDPIFRGNPHLAFTAAHPKPVVLRLIDLAFQGLTRPARLKKGYERLVHRLSERRARNGEPRLVHIDMLIHSYAEGETKGRMIWKTGGDIAQVIARNFGIADPAGTCRMAFDEEDSAAVADLRRTFNLTVPFIIVEPNTNTDWFGELRAWPFERWQAVVDSLTSRFPDLTVAQVGVAGNRSLKGAIDLCGKTTFRQAVLLLRSAALFVGTEGGLMHAANAVGARAVILWGGVTLPTFAGYPASQTIIHRAVPCAPCGNLGWCDNGHICMLGISEQDTIDTIVAALEAAWAA